MPPGAEREGPGQPRPPVQPFTVPAAMACPALSRGRSHPHAGRPRGHPD